MITGRLDKGMELKLLRIFYKRYITRFGRGVRHLDDFEISIASEDFYAKFMPELREQDANRVRSRFIDITRELEAGGLLRLDSPSYYLTEDGYRLGGMTRTDRFLDFCNRNAGMAVIVAVVSAAVSAASLIVAIVALSNPPTAASCPVGVPAESAPAAAPPKLPKYFTVDQRSYVLR